MTAHWLSQLKQDITKARPSIARIEAELAGHVDRGGRMSEVIPGPKGPRWDKTHTKELLLRAWGYQRVETCELALRSVATRQLHAQYHFAECRRLVKEHVGQPIEQGGSIWEFVSPETDEELLGYHMFFVRFEANLLACTLAIHAIADNLAYLVYYALGMDEEPAPIREYKVGLHTVVEKLNSLAIRRSELGRLSTCLSRLKDDSAFKDVDEIANHSKHRGAPGAKLAVEPTGEDTFEMRIGDFMRDQTHRPAREFAAILAPAFRVINESVVDVGVALNDWLTHKLAANE